MGAGSSDSHGDPMRSVRVEVDNGALGAPVPEPLSAQEAPTRSTAFAAIAVCGVLAALAAVLFLLSPDAGQTADGSPITPPTLAEQAITTTTATTTRPAFAPGSMYAQPRIPAELGDPVFPLEAFDSRGAPGFLFNITAFDWGWLAVAFNGVNSTDLVRSTDGFDWTPVALDEQGIVIAAGKVDGRAVIAVEVAQDEVFARDTTAPYEVRFFDSNDIETWAPSSLFGPMSGEGNVFPAAIGDDAVALPALETETEPDPERLVRFFDGVVNPDRARQICSADNGAIGGTLLVNLRDCEGELLGELNQYDAPELFEERNFISDCVAALRTPREVAERLLIQRRAAPDTDTDIDAGIEAIDQPFVGLGKMFGTTHLSMGRARADDECLGQAAAGSGWQLYRATAEEGSSIVEGLGGFYADNGNLVQTKDGDAMIIGGTGQVAGTQLLRSSAPYTEWESVELWNTPDLNSAFWSATPDGSMFMGSTSKEWIFFRSSGEIVAQLAIVGAEVAQVVVATSEYAVVQLDFETERLVKVPLTE